MRMVDVPGLIEAVSPISHNGSEKTGNVPILREVACWDAEQGKRVTVPYLSGNAIRGILRRLIMRDMIETLNYEVQSRKLHHALYSGGNLESTDDNTGVIDIALRTQIRDTIPALGVLGTAIGNQMLPGCLIDELAMPVCRERRRYLSESLLSDPRVAVRAEQHVRTFTDFVYATRRDDLHAERDADEQAQQMLIEFQTFIPGTLFTHGFRLEEPSTLEASCLGRMIDLWMAKPFVGGKSGSGHGHVRLQYENKPDGAIYVAYLHEKAGDVHDVLGTLASRLEPPKTEKRARK